MNSEVEIESCRRAIYSYRTPVIEVDVIKKLNSHEFDKRFNFLKGGKNETRLIDFILRHLYHFPYSNFDSNNGEKKFAKVDISSSIWWANQKLADYFGLPLKAIERALKNLSQKNIIVRKRKHGHRYIAFSPELIDFLVSSQKTKIQNENISNANNSPPTVGGLPNSVNNSPPTVGGNKPPTVGGNKPPTVGGNKPPTVGGSHIDRKGKGKENGNKREGKKSECTFVEQIVDKFPPKSDSPPQRYKNLNVVDFLKQYYDPFVRDSFDFKSEIANRQAKLLFKTYGAKILFEAFEAYKGQLRNIHWPQLIRQNRWDIICAAALENHFKQIDYHNQNS